MRAGMVIFCFSSSGERTARRLARTACEQVVPVKPGTLGATVTEWWDRAGALVFVSSLGVAVRAVAPHLADKAADPAVVLVTEDGKTVLPVTGAHLGGGQDLAVLLASRLGVEPVLTTSSDRAGLEAPDLLASRRRWCLLGRNSLPGVNRALLESGILGAWVDPLIPHLALPPVYERVTSPGEAKVLVSPSALPLEPGQVHLVPRCITAGMGCRKGTSIEALRSVLERAFSEAGILSESLREIRTVEEKTGEPGLRALAEELGVPLAAVGRCRILSLGGSFSPSASERHLSLPGVAEPCAASAGRLLGPRIAEKGVTAALSAGPAHGGRLFVLGTGPGDGDYVTLAGRRVLEEADAVVGYGLYASLLPPSWLQGKLVETYSMGEEEKRVERAVSLAEEGRTVVLLSGGDPVLFGLAGLAHRTAMGRVPVVTLPGITAAQAAGALLGAPYVNGLVLISLSDYLQPWPAVRRALEGAALSGLTAALYNPVRKNLGEKVEALRDIFSRAGYDSVHLLRDVGRPDQSSRTMNLRDLSAADLDMRTLLILPGAGVESVDGLLLGRRGYRSEGEDPGNFGNSSHGGMG